MRTERKVLNAEWGLRGMQLNKKVVIKFTVALGSMNQKRVSIQ